MDAAAFDPLAIARRFREVGFDEARAEAVMDGAATRADVSPLEAEIAGPNARVEAGIERAVDRLMPAVFGAATVAAVAGPPQAPGAGA